MNNTVNGRHPKQEYLKVGIEISVAYKNKHGYYQKYNINFFRMIYIYAIIDGYLFLFIKKEYSFLTKRNKYNKIIES